MGKNVLDFLQNYWKWETKQDEKTARASLYISALISLAFPRARGLASAVCQSARVASCDHFNSSGHWGRALPEEFFLGTFQDWVGGSCSPAQCGSIPDSSWARAPTRLDNGNIQQFAGLEGSAHLSLTFMLCFSIGEYLAMTLSLSISILLRGGSESLNSCLVQPKKLGELLLGSEWLNLRRRLFTFYSPQFNLISDNNSYWFAGPVPSILALHFYWWLYIMNSICSCILVPAPHQIILVLLQWLSCARRACGWPGHPHCWLQSILALSGAPTAGCSQFCTLPRYLVSYRLSSWGCQKHLGSPQFLM